MTDNDKKKLLTVKVELSKEGLAGKKEKSKNIGMTEIKDSHCPRAEIKCPREAFLNREPDFARKGRAVAP